MFPRVVKSFANKEKRDMLKLFAEIQVPFELREKIKEKKGSLTYEKYFRHLMENQVA